MSGDRLIFALSDFKGCVLQYIFCMNWLRLMEQVRRQLWSSELQ